MTAQHNQTSKIQYLKGILWSSCGSLIAMSASMITTVIAARRLSKDSLGSFFLVLLISQLAASLGDLGLRNTSIRFISSEDHAEAGNVSRYVLTITLVFSTITSLVVAAICSLMSNKSGTPEFKEIMLSCAPLTFTLINYQVTSSILVGFKKFKALSTIVSSVEILRMAVGVLSLALGFGVKGLVFSCIFAQFAGLLLNWSRMPFKYRWLLRHPKEKQILQFGGWLYATSVMSVINVRATEAILTHNLGPAALAVYGTAMQIPNVIQKMFESIRPVILSYISSLKRDMYSSTISAMRLSSGLLTLAAAGIMLFANPIITAFFSYKYAQSIPVMQMACAWIAISVVNYFLSITLIGMGKARKVFFLTIPQFVVMSLSSLVLIPKYQSSGAVIALILTAITGNILASYMISGGTLSLFLEMNLSTVKSYILLVPVLFLLHLYDMSFVVNIFLFLALICGLYLVKAITQKDLSSIRGLIVKA
jgi:O-antigen/teichoic acid export membrane protein